MSIVRWSLSPCVPANKLPNACISSSGGSDGDSTTTRVMISPVAAAAVVMCVFMSVCEDHDNRWESLP